MNTRELIIMFENNVDDVESTDVVIGWLNAGQNRMAVDARATFPQLPSSSDDTGLSATFVFPEKYHEIPVLYASAMFKAKDSALREKESFLTQFYAGVADFVENYTVPMQYRDDELCQQFIASDEQDTFQITKDGYHPIYGNLKVYVNGARVYVAQTFDNTFTLYQPCVEGDRVTALWEEHAAFNEPPMKHWKW